MHKHAALYTLFALLSNFQTIAGKNITITPASKITVWEGWGVSLAWWANIFGDRDDLASIFFSNKWQNWNDQNLPGLWLNIVRYNAGACTYNTIDGHAMVQTMRKSRQMEGFWLNSTSSDPVSSSWDWTADSKQRSMLLKAQQQGADTFELFSNSPMWWMCNNNNPGGADAAFSNNLKPSNYENHATYLANIAQHARDNWDIDFQSVEPFNEPSLSGQDVGRQEACHFDVNSQAKVISQLRDKLDRAGLHSTLISSSDESTYNDAISTWTKLGDEIRSKVGRINVHGYQYLNGNRQKLYALSQEAGKKLWTSEYGDSDPTGEKMVRSLMKDFETLHPSAWVHWQAIDGPKPGWGLMVGDLDQKVLQSVTTKYFALAHFSRHIRPAMAIVAAHDQLVAAYDARSRKLVIVAANWNQTQEVHLNLSHWRKVGTGDYIVSSWRTRIGGGESYKRHDNICAGGKILRCSFESGTIQTIEIASIIM